MAAPQTQADSWDGGAESAPPAPLSVRRKRRPLTRIAIAMGSAAMMAGLGIFALFLLLSAGPVSMPYLADRVAEALESRIGAGIDITVGEAKLERSAAGIEVHIYDVSFRDASGKEILRSPEALVSFDPLQLAAFRFAPSRLSLQGIVVKAEVRPDGEIRVATADRKGATAQAAPIEEAMAFLIGVARTGTLAGLSDLAISDAMLVIDDQRVGREVAFDRLQAVFETRTPGRSVIAGSVSRAGEDIPFRLEAIAEGEGARLDLSVSKLPLRVAETVGGLGALPFSSTMTASLKSSLTVAADGKPLTGSIEASLTPGQLTVPAIGEHPLGISEAHIKATWAGNPRKIDAVAVRFAGAGGEARISGVLSLPENTAGLYRFEGRTEALTLAPLSPQDKPITVTEGHISATASASLSELRIERLALTGPETALTLTGEAARSDAGHGLKLKVQAGRMPVRSALRWWPLGVSEDARIYLKDAVQDGTLAALNLSLDLPPAALKAALANEPLPPDSFRAEFTVENGAMRILDGLPSLTGMAATGWVSAKEGLVTASRAQIDLKGQGRRIQLSEGSAQLQGLDQPTPDIAIVFRAQAAAEHAAEFLTLPPLREFLTVKLNPADVRGQFEGRGRIAFPLKQAIKPADVATEASATLRGVTIEKAIGRDRLENATLTISADRTGVEVKGDGRWQGMPVTVSLDNDAADKSSATVMSFTLDDAALRRIGFDGSLRGPVPVKVKALREDGGSLRAQVEADLTRAAIDGLLPGFQKPAGRAGKLTFEATERPKGYAIANLALDSGTASFRGQADVGQDGAVNSARFSLFRLSAGDNVRLDFERSGGGGRATIRGNNFDARPFLRTALQDAAPNAKAERDIDLDLKTTLLSGHGGEVLTNAEVKMQRRGGQVRQLVATGRLNGKAASIGGQATDRPATLAIESDDAGALLRFLDLYSRMIGGDLTGQVRPSAREVGGFFIARSFSLRNEPAISRLISEGAPGDAPRADSATFTKMRLDFSRVGTATTIKDAVIFGPQIGLTFNGLIDSGRDRVSLSGTFVPAYGLNNAFAQIPVLGNILGGGRNEGLLAVTFGVSGRASQPQISVNPLSAVAPGIFRKIFEFRNERTGTLPNPSAN